MGKKKRRGHYCRICGKVKANEKFSGKGHKNHICKSCSRLSPEQRKKKMEKEDQEDREFAKEWNLFMNEDDCGVDELNVDEFDIDFEFAEYAYSNDCDCECDENDADVFCWKDDDDLPF